MRSQCATHEIRKTEKGKDQSECGEARVKVDGRRLSLHTHHTHGIDACA